MQFEFSIVLRAQGAQLQAVQSTLEIFANDRALNCLMLTHHHHGRVEFRRNTRGNTMPVLRPIAAVNVVFTGSGYESLDTLAVILVDNSEFFVARVPSHEHGNAHINSYELGKFVQALHAKWQKEK